MDFSSLSLFIIATAYRKSKIGASFSSNAMKEGMFDLHPSLLTPSCLNIEKLSIIVTRHSTIRVSVCL